MNYKHSKMSQVDVEPFRTSLFECKFLINGISDKTTDLLTEQIVSIDRHNISFKINLVGDQIEPLDTILEMMHEKLDIEILIHDKSGKVFGKILYKDVTIIGTDFFENVFSYGDGSSSFEFQDESLPLLNVTIFISSIFYNDVAVD